MKIKILFYELGDHQDTLGTVVGVNSSGFICEIDKVIEINNIPYDRIRVILPDASLYDIVQEKYKFVKAHLYTTGEDEFEIVTCKCRLDGVVDVKIDSS